MLNYTSDELREDFVDSLPYTGGTSDKVLADMILNRIREYEIRHPG